MADREEEKEGKRGRGGTNEEDEWKERGRSRIKGKNQRSESSFISHLGQNVDVTNKHVLAEYPIPFLWNLAEEGKKRGRGG